MALKVIFGILLFIPLTFALTDTISFSNCQNLGIVCPLEEDLQGITDQDKLKILLDLIIPRNFPEAYEDIIKFNSGLKYTAEPPQGVNVQNAQNIENAWVKIMTFTPSVYSDSDIIVPSKSNVFTGYHYELKKPSDYNGGDSSCGPGPQNEFGDCRTQFDNPVDKTKLSVYKDGMLLGNSGILGFSNNVSVSNFKAALTIVNEIGTKHHKWEKSNACCRERCSGKPRKCVCTEWYYDCRYAGQDNVQYKLDIVDLATIKNDSSVAAAVKNITYNYYSPRIEYFAKINENSGLGYRIDIGSSTIKKAKKVIVLDRILQPYSPIVARAINIVSYQTDIGTFLVNDTPFVDYNLLHYSTFHPFGKCFFMVIGYYGQFTSECFPVLFDAKLELSSIRTVYNVNELFKLHVTYTENGNLVKALIKIDYGNYTNYFEVNGESDIELNAKEGSNKIQAYYVTEKGTVYDELTVRGSDFDIVSSFFFLLTILLVMWIVRWFVHQKEKHGN